MKKSKLIVPAALAVMLLSTAASVTGTVAWFTANRAVTISADNFEVVSTDGNLTYDLDAGNCTTITGNAGEEAVTIATSNNSPTKKLTDASVDFSDPASPVVYTDLPNDGVDQNGQPLQPSEFSAVALSTGSNITPLTAGEYAVPSTNSTVYYCATWKITFTYDFSAGGGSVHLFFNTAASNGSVFGNPTVTNAGTNSKSTSTGFRIGMTTGSKAVIFAGLQETSNCTFIHNNNTTTTATAYAATGTGSLIASDTTRLALAADNLSTSDASARADYLGTIAKPNDATTASLAVTCYAWFEGSDPNVINGSDLVKMAATLKFYTRRSA